MRWHRSWLVRLLTIQTDDPDARRRGRSLVSIGVVMLALLAPLVALWYLQGDLPGSLAGLACMLLFAAAVWLARRGRVMAGATLFSVTVTLVVVALMVSVNEVVNASFYLLLPVSAAALIFPRRMIWPTLAFNVAGLLAVAGWISLTRPLSYGEGQNVQDSITLLVGVALAGMLGARSIDAALDEARSARGLAERTAADLDRANADLERRIAERTGALEQALNLQLEQAAELQRSVAQQQQLTALVSELSLPIIPISDTVLVAPLVGSIGADRADQLVTRLLEAIEQRRARAIILDVTGVAIVDTQLAQTLVRAAAAAHLLGAQVVLAGIRPEMAQTLVSLGADLHSLQTVATLQSGLALVAQRA